MDEYVTSWTKKRRRPKIVIYRVADPGLRFVLNRYGGVHGSGGVVIGIALVVGARCVSLVWAQPASKRVPVHVAGKR